MGEFTNQDYVALLILQHCHLFHVQKRILGWNSPRHNTYTNGAKTEVLAFRIQITGKCESYSLDQFIDKCDGVSSTSLSQLDKYAVCKAVRQDSSDAILHGINQRRWTNAAWFENPLPSNSTAVSNSKHNLLAPNIISWLQLHVR